MQLRWIVSTIAFGNAPNVLSYSEFPQFPPFYLGEFDAGWFIDDIALRGLLAEEVHLLPDGGDDPLVGSEVLCGENLVAETLAVERPDPRWWRKLWS